MPVRKVDETTFSALSVAHAAIKFARAALPYGSPNQYADWIAMRTGKPCDGTLLPRLVTVRNGVTAVMSRPVDRRLLADMTWRSYWSAVSAGVAMFYGAGNCGEHACLTYSFLVTYGFPGLTIRNVSSSVIDHAFCVIEWPGCNDAVVCDAWPSKPQPCLWSEFFANPANLGTPAPAFREIASHVITPENMGHDLVGEAFRLVDPAIVGGLPREQAILPSLPDEVLRLRASSYGHLSTLAQKFQPWVDYDFNSQMLSQVLPTGQKWTATVLPAIADVNSRLKVLDPNLRYAGTRQ